MFARHVGEGPEPRVENGVVALKHGGEVLGGDVEGQAFVEEL